MTAQPLWITALEVTWGIKLQLDNGTYNGKWRGCTVTLTERKQPLALIEVRVEYKGVMVGCDVISLTPSPDAVHSAVTSTMKQVKRKHRKKEQA